MRSRSFIIVVVALAALLVLAGGVVAYDRSHKDEIADGITVGGVDVGGLTAAQARTKLDRAFVSGLQRPIVVRHGSDSWTLTAGQARVTANVDATVQDALDRSREGGILSRVWRNATGGTIDEQIHPEVTYSQEAVTRLVRRVRRAIDRQPVDAKVSFSVSGLDLQRSRLGLAVDNRTLTRRLRDTLVSPTAKRRIGVVTRHTEPKVTERKLEQQYQTALVLNRNAFRLTLYKNLKPARSYEVAVGAVGLETPAGLYHIQNKAVNPAWTKPYSDWVPKDEQGTVVPGGTPENPLKARWMGIFDGAGIHGIDPSEYGTIGHAASHGCVRMRIPDVIDLYNRVPVGAPIYIA